MFDATSGIGRPEDYRDTEFAADVDAPNYQE
jgi:hypothetical protein